MNNQYARNEYRVEAAKRVLDKANTLCNSLLWINMIDHTQSMDKAEIRELLGNKDTFIDKYRSVIMGDYVLIRYVNCSPEELDIDTTNIVLDELVECYFNCLIVETTFHFLRTNLRTSHNFILGIKSDFIDSYQAEEIQVADEIGYIEVYQKDVWFYLKNIA